ncbi:MAG: FimV/HubP family polar landmark protein [Pseudomonadota bacterium]
MRNLGLIVALWLSVLLPTNALALGLGEIEVKSFLNQPLNAEIEVISARAGEIDDLLVSLASRDAFTRAGLSRPRHLSDLKFTVRKSEDGESAVILVTTKSGVKEPFLNFLIEADWSKGRVLREFTVLLDPPFFAEQQATEPSQPAQQTISEDSSVSEIVEQSGVTASDSSESTPEPIALSEDPPESTAEPESSDYVASESQNIIEGDVLVVKGDTLWGIASRFKTDEHSMAQVMLAFQRANPEAFNDNNINNLKEGAILRAPGAGEYDAVGNQEAYAEVLVQNGLWDDYVARVTGVSPAVAAEGSDGGSTATEESSGELSLLLPADGDSDSSGSNQDADADELRTRLALAEEELDASRIENSELESRIAELQARLSKVEELQKMVEIEDDSLAQLQADQAEVQEEVVDATETAEVETVSEAIEADEEALLEELLAEEAAAQAEEQAALQDSSTDTVSDDALLDDDVLSDDALVDDDVLIEDEASQTGEAETAPPPAPVIVTESAVREPSIFDGILPPNVIAMLPSMSGLLGNPIVLGAVGGVIILILLLILIKRRKAGSDDDSGDSMGAGDDLFASDDDEELTPIHLADGAPEETDIKIPTEEDLSDTATATMEAAADDEEDEFSSTAIISQQDMPEPEAPAAAAPADQDDVLNEVDVYLAYGLYDNAEELLNSNLEADPDRADYRSKLLDTYFATKNVDAFVKEAENLKSMGDAASGYWDRVQVMGYELAPDNALFSDAKDSGMSAADLEIAKPPQEADFDLGASDDDDTNFSTTDFNLGEDDTGGDFTDTAEFGEAGDVSSTQQMEAVEEAELPSLDDDDDDATNVRVEVSPDLAAEDNLELPDDIGGELEFSMDEETPVESEEPAAEDEVMDLPDDLDLGADEDDELTAEPPARDDDEDLPMEFDVGDDADVEAEDDASEIDFGAEFEAALEEADELDVDESELIPFEDSLEDDSEIDLEIDADDANEDEDSVVIDAPEEDDIPDFEQTAIVDTTPGYEETAVIPAADSEASEDSEIDLGMEDTAMMEGEEGASDDDLVLDIGGDDDEEDISIIDFGGDDFEEPTGSMESVSDDDSIALDVDMDDGTESKTGTFAPGDFDEPTAAVDSVADIDDIGDLMLPDDVDEVSTKLDLARAFIDMGDTEGARGSLEEVMSEGNDEQKAEAKTLLDSI